MRSQPSAAESLIDVPDSTRLPSGDAAAAAPRVLVVDDEQHVLDALSIVLEEKFQVTPARDGESALALAAQRRFAVALLDIMLPGMDGMEILRRLREISPDTVAIMVTANRDLKTAVAAMRLGAYDYIVKPFEEAELLLAVEKAAERASLGREVASLREQVAGACGMGEMIGATQVMQELFKVIGKVAARDVPVLITGESGTGKELVARAIHYGSWRKNGPFVSVNSARLGSDVAESELFGHEKGSFTGASGLHHGKFEQADRGSLFLDEIDSMPLRAQAQILRAIEEGRITRIGGEKPVEVDARLLAATNSDLSHAAAERRFREDLFYRLNVIHLHVPPLRERRADIPLLAEFFVRKHRGRIRSPVRGFSQEAMEALQEHPWRGNVRELENVVQTLLCLAEDEIVKAEDLEAPILAVPGPAAPAPAPGNDSREILLKALQDSCWSIQAAARQLGVHRNTVRNLMARHGIRKPMLEDLGA